jgi:hypothetical protein
MLRSVFCDLSTSLDLARLRTGRGPKASLSLPWAARMLRFVEKANERADLARVDFAFSA